MSIARKATTRVDVIDLPAIRRIAAEHDWLTVGAVTGRGQAQVIDVTFPVPAYAWGESQKEPTPKSGPWRAKIFLSRGMADPPLVRIEPDEDGLVPVSGSITDWDVPPGVPSEFGVQGLVCYAQRWNATRYSLGWVAMTCALIVSGNAMSLSERRPLSPAGRDWQRKALRLGWLPTHAISRPRDELLYLVPVETERAETSKDLGIEFDE